MEAGFVRNVVGQYYPLGVCEVGAAPFLLEPAVVVGILVCEPVAGLAYRYVVSF
jgi:hypothetical protein